MFSALPSGTSITYAKCTDGKKLLGGGGGITDVFTASAQSRPIMIYNGPAANGSEEWNIIWVNEKEVATSVNILVYAICADVSQ